MSYTSLERTVITTKLGLARFGSVHELLAQAISPPKAQRVSQALRELHRYAALASGTEDADVTHLGRLAAALPFDLPMVRLVVFGHACGILPEAIVIASAFSTQDLFSMPSSIFMNDDQEFAQALATNLGDRTRLDAGHYSEAWTALHAYRSARPRHPPPWVGLVGLSRFARAPTSVRRCVAVFASVDWARTRMLEKRFPLITKAEAGGFSGWCRFGGRGGAVDIGCLCRRRLWCKRRGTPAPFPRKESSL